MKGTVVVVPAFNEARTIADVVSALAEQSLDRIVVVDDGSTDGTARRVQALARARHSGPEIELLRHPDNLGKGFALAGGIARALELAAQRIVTIDADGQHSAADVPRLERVAVEAPGAVVIAARTRDRNSAPRLRRFGNDVADFWISWACGRRIADTQSGFRLYPARLLAELPTRAHSREGFAFETRLLLDAVRAGATLRRVSIASRYPAGGRASHYRPWRDTWSIIRLVGGTLLRRGLYPAGLAGALARTGESGKRRALSFGDGD